MDERLKLLIFDDEKKAIWDTFFSTNGYVGYLDFKICIELDDALRYLVGHCENIHIVLSDFWLVPTKRDVPYLDGVRFTNTQTTAMGANLTFLAEGLMKRSGCTILVNKLYTAASDQLKDHSLESYLLHEYYFDREKILRPLKEISAGIEDLVAEALQEAQQWFFSHADRIGNVQRQLHSALSLDLATNISHSNLSEQSDVDELLEDVSTHHSMEQRKMLQEKVFEILNEYLEAQLDDRKTTVRLPMAALFPQLHFGYDQYCKYQHLSWAPGTLKKFSQFVERLKEVQKLCRDNTQAFGMFLSRHRVLGFLHGEALKTDDGKSPLSSQLLENAAEPPFNDISGLREVLQYLVNEVSQGASSNDLSAFADFFKYGCLVNTDLCSRLSLSSDFIGFRLDGKIVDHLIKSLQPAFAGVLDLENVGDDYVVADSDGRGMGDRIFTDKTRILNSVRFVLAEVQAHLAKHQLTNKQVHLSFGYDKEMHCGKLIIEDFGNGMLEVKLGRGSPRDGGWAQVSADLTGWVEDLWIVSRSGNDIKGKSFFRKDEFVNEGKNEPGTKVVLLFNLISDVS